MFLKSLFKIKNRAFTLIEMLIVMAIVVIISSLIFLNYGKQKQHFALQRSTYKLAQDIRKASEMGMSARVFKGEVPRGGYGIYFSTASPTSYILFADLDGDHLYSGPGEEEEEINLEKRVYIKEILPPSYSFLNITFQPPNPTVTISNEDGTSTTSEATIVLSLETDPAITRKIKINSAGLIDID